VLVFVLRSFCDLAFGDHVTCTWFRALGLRHDLVSKLISAPFACLVVYASLLSFCTLVADTLIATPVHLSVQHVYFSVALLNLCHNILELTNQGSFHFCFRPNQNIIIYN